MKDKLISIIGFIVSVLTIIVTTLNSEFDITLKVALICFSSISSIVLLINNFAVSKDLLELKTLQKILAYSVYPTNLLLNRLLPILSNYSKKRFKTRYLNTSTLKHKKYGTILYLNFTYSSNQKDEAGCLFLNQEDIVELTIDFNKNVKKIFSALNDCGWNYRTERIGECIVPIIYDEGSECHYHSSTNTIKVVAYNKENQIKGDEVLFNSDLLDALFLQPAYVRDRLIKEKLIKALW